MLDELGPFLVGGKRADLVRRLNSRRVDQSPPAEIELSILWSVMQFGEIEIEPSWWPTSRRPEVFVRELYPSQSAVIEVAAVSDGSMSGDELMRKCSLTIADFCNTITKGVGPHLYFQFAETSQVIDGVYIRNISAPRNHNLSSRAKEVLRKWVRAPSVEPSPLRLRDGDLDVIIRREGHKHFSHQSFWSSRPPVADSLKLNPIYTALNQKLHQVEHAPEGVLRIIVLAEVGSRVLEELGSTMRAGRYSAKEIIRRFMNDKRGRVDVVLVVSPWPGGTTPTGDVEGVWPAWLFWEVPNQKLGDAIDRMVAKLPPARLTGANARSQLRAQAERPNLSPDYRNPKMVFKRGDTLEMKYSISSRALLDFLSGKINEQQFRSSIGDTEGGLQSRTFVSEGMTIQAAHIESGAPDHDDDRIVFELGKDAAVQDFE
jgi:hypothetical protein